MSNHLFLKIKKCYKYTFVLGRNIPEAREKREVGEHLPTKEGAYMRYAKNANFVRFGRNQRVNSIIPDVNRDMTHFPNNIESKYHNFKIKHLLEELKRRQKGAFIF